MSSCTPEAAQQREQLEGLGGGDQFPALAHQVVLGDQPFDDRGARGRRAKALLGHRLAQLVVVDELARAFHRREQRGLAVARRRPGGQRLHLGAQRVHLLARLHGHQRGVGLATAGDAGFLERAAVDGQPPGVGHHAALGLERMLFDHGDPGGHHVFGRREEHGQEAPHDQVVDALLGVAEVPGHLQRRDDREVVADLGVVEDALVRPDPPVGLDLPRELGELRQLLELAEGVADGAHVVLGQRARVGPRVGEHLVLLVQRLRDRQRGLGREAEAAVGLALQAGEVEQRRRQLGGGLGLLGDHPGLAGAGAQRRRRLRARSQRRSARASGSSPLRNRGSNQRPSYSPALAWKLARTSK